MLDYSQWQSAFTQRYDIGRRKSKIGAGFSNPLDNKVGIVDSLRQNNYVVKRWLRCRHGGKIRSELGVSLSCRYSSTGGARAKAWHYYDQCAENPSQSGCRVPVFSVTSGCVHVNQEFRFDDLI